MGELEVRRDAAETRARTEIEALGTIALTNGSPARTSSKRLRVIRFVIRSPWPPPEDRSLPVAPELIKAALKGEGGEKRRRQWARIRAT
jgi:hypothetical protein